jgi:hypothetical protein
MPRRSTELFSTTPHAPVVPTSALVRGCGGLIGRRFPRISTIDEKISAHYVTRDHFLPVPRNASVFLALRRSASVPLLLHIFRIRIQYDSNQLI